MRFSIVILIWISLVFQCFVQLGIVKWYDWNQQAITERYCINKDKPKMHCNGKCYLKKQLQKLGNEPSKDRETSRQIEWVVFLVPEKIVLRSLPPQHITEYALIYQRPYTYLSFHSVFHPPQVV